MYDRLRGDSDNEALMPLSEGHNVYYLFNIPESQLWLDGAKYNGLSWFQNVSGFLQFAETCYIDKCNTFTSCIISTYRKSFLEISPLLFLWLVLAQPEHSHCLVYQMFGNKYMCV